MLHKASGLNCFLILQSFLFPAFNLTVLERSVFHLKKLPQYHTYLMVLFCNFRKANRSYRPHASPIIVQSTNGGGRAGSYILLDMTLNHIAKGAREVDIAASLEHLRDQRIGIVKTKEQFEFVLICVAEEIAAIVKSSRDASGSSSPE